MSEIVITFAESALRDLEEIQTWYAKQGVPKVGQRLVEEIFQQAESLQTHPDIGRVVPEFNQPFLRELICPPYRIIYRGETSRIRIVQRMAK